MDQKHIEEGKGIAWLSYLGILFVIPLITHRDNPYVIHHVKQGIGVFALWVVWTLWGIISWVLQMAVSQFSDTATCCTGPLFSLVGLAIAVFALVLSVIGIVKALSGELWVAPVVGPIADKIKL